MMHEKQTLLANKDGASSPLALAPGSASARTEAEARLSRTYHAQPSADGTWRVIYSGHLGQARWSGLRTVRCDMTEVEARHLRAELFEAQMRAEMGADYVPPNNELRNGHNEKGQIQ